MISFNRQNKIFRLSCGSAGYMFKVDEYGFLRHLYFGELLSEQETLSFAFRDEDRGFSSNFGDAKDRTASLDTILNECPVSELGDNRMPALLIKTPDGCTRTDFRFRSYKISDEKIAPYGLPYLRGGKTLQVQLYDTEHSLSLDLFYTVYDDENAIVRRMELKNESNCPVRIKRLNSFNLDIADGEFECLRLYGRPCAERMPVWENCAPGITQITSGLRGSSSHYLNPFFALKRKNTTESYGEAYGFSLVYSGEFSLTAEVSQYGAIRVQGGINDVGFEWFLAGGESFSTPEAVLVYSNSGVGAMSRTFHSLYRKYLLRERFAFQNRPIVVNNWEATYFDFNEEKLFALIDKAAELGADTFVLDDGWFQNRNNDNGGLGDWQIDETKLSGGLKAISARCKERGIGFGLWFEPEMVNENTKLYAEHPEWCLKYPSGGVVRGRNQLLLDYCNPAVVDYVFEKMSRIIDGNGISFVKWDMNRYLADRYSAFLPPERRGETGHRYVLGVYSLAERLIARFPELIMEGCSGGGGRFDAGMLYYFPQIWTSDNTDAYSRTLIQHGTSFGYPYSCISNHFSACPNHQTHRTVSAEARYVVASVGTFGYELDICKLNQTECREVKRQIERYRRDEEFVLQGDLYRLNCGKERALWAVAQVLPGKKKARISGLFGLIEANMPQKRLKIDGLDDELFYKIEETGAIVSGKALRTVGILLNLPGEDFSAIEYHLTAV